MTFPWLADLESESPPAGVICANGLERQLGAERFGLPPSGYIEQRG
jgi:hypothetical protein